jgi:hypothetical protein
MSEVETNPIQDLIQYSIDQNFKKAGDSFNDIMTIKMNDILDQEKIRIADQMYNGVEDEQEDDGQLELDLDGDDEEISGESSEDQDPDEEDAGIDDEAEYESEEDEEDEDED